MEDFLNDSLENKARIIQPDEGECYNIEGSRFTFKVTSEMTLDQLGIYEIMLQPGTIGAKLHYHRFMDETFIVTQGTLTILLGSDVEKAVAGTVIHVPRFTPHGFRNDFDKVVKLMLIFNPSMKREGFFKGLCKTLSEKPINPEKFLKLYNKYDSFPVDRDDMIQIEQ